MVHFGFPLDSVVPDSAVNFVAIASAIDFVAKHTARNCVCTGAPLS